MKLRPGLGVSIACLLALAAPARAQLTGSNLLLGQVGNLPPSFADRGPANRQSLYDQLNLAYVFGPGLAGFRFETDRNSEESLEYEGITQRYVDWSDQGYRLRVGNFHTILGRGLVERSFELPGVVLEKTGVRSRFAPSRDVDGVLAEADKGPLSARLLAGSPSEGFFSLAEERTFDEPRHRGHLAGGQLALTLWREARVGAAYARTSFARPDRDALQQEIGSGFVELDPLRLAGIAGTALPIYAEYAQLDRTFEEWWRFRREDAVPHALYAGTDLIWGPFALSAEWKDYAGFGLGINDPPAVVREHSAALLNRATHVLDARREEGYQLEASLAPVEWLGVTVNRTRADAARGDRMEELFSEVRATSRQAERWEASVFWDRAFDSTQSILRRDTYGTLATVRFLGRWSATLDVQRQTATRKGFDLETLTIEPRRFENVYVSLAGALAERGTVAVLWERTTDDLDPSWDPGRSGPLHLVSWTVSARLAQRHDAVLFLGKRRGGLACTAGTCYEVQPFEGAELRVVSRF